MGLLTEDFIEQDLVTFDAFFGIESCSYHNVYGFKGGSFGWLHSPSNESTIFTQEVLRECPIIRDFKGRIRLDGKYLREKILDRLPYDYKHKVRNIKFKTSVSRNGDKLHYSILADRKLKFDDGYFETNTLATITLFIKDFREENQ